jgi:biotin carboxylase
MKQDEKWLIAVTAGKWQKHGIKEARLLGLKVIGIDADPEAEGFDEVDYKLIIPFDNHQNIIEALRKINFNYCGAVSFCSEVGMMLAGKIREAFHLPGPDSDLCRKLLEKGIQRKIWSNAGVPGPEWKIFESPDTAFLFIQNSKLPVIIKPTDSSGSRGVTKIESLDENVKDAVSRAFKFSLSNQVIVESFMDGTEFTVEVFVINGKVNVLAVTEKKKVEGTKGTVASELSTPDRPNEIVEKLKNAVIEAFMALDYTDGPGHAEIILKKDGSVGLVEVAGRGGGFMVFNGLVPAVSGVNIAKITALQAIGESVILDSILTNAAVLRFFPSILGKLVSISGFEIANDLPGVQCEPFVKPGSIFHNAAADGDRLGYILTVASSAIEAQKLANEVEKLIKFDIINLE